MHLLVALLLCVGSFPGASPAAAQTLAYVANFESDSVSVIDTATNTVIATVAVESGPFDVAITPDGSRAYVTNRNATPPTVSVISTATNMVVASIQVGDDPSGIAITSDGTRAYVCNSVSNDVSVIETASNTVVATIPGVATRPEGIAITPDGSRAYVVLRNSNTVKVIDTSTNSIVDTIPVGGLPFRVAITPDGTRAYVTNSAAFGGANAVSVIDTATNTVVDSVGGGSFPVPRGVAITPDGTRAYVASALDPDAALNVIDTATNTVVDTTDLAPGDTPYLLAITPDGNRVYVTNILFNVVHVIDTANNGVIDTIGVGDFPAGIAVFVLNSPPDCTNTSPGIARLWPPNHKFVPVTIEGVSDPDGDPATITIDSVFQDEPLDGLGDGRFEPDGFGIGTDTSNLRAERSGRGDGRVYHVTFSATDEFGGECTGNVTVCVPHNRKGDCVDQGPLFDSTGGS